MSARAVAGRDARGAVVVPVLLAAVTGVVLWQGWRAAGSPVGTFARGVTGHGPDPLAWPRFLWVWVPLAQVLFPLAYRLIARRAPLATGRHVCADQLSLGVFALVGGSLVAVGTRWMPAVGVAYVVFVAVKTAVFAHFARRAVAGEAQRARASGLIVFLGALLPFILLDGYLTAAVSTTGDEPYYLLLAHSLVEDHDTNLADDLRDRDYLPFYWGVLDDRVNMRLTADGGVYSRAHVGLFPVLVAPGYAVAGRLGAMVTVSALAAGALAIGFALAIRLGARPTSAFAAWAGVAFSAPVLSHAGPIWPEMPAALFGTLAASILLGARRDARRVALAVAALGALCTLKLRFVLTVVPLAAGFVRRLSWTALGTLAGALLLLLVGAIAYDALLTAGFFLGEAHGGVGATARWLALLLTAPVSTAPRGLLGFLADQEHGVLAAAPLLLLALPGAVLLGIQRRWRELLLLAGPFVTTWYCLGGLHIGGVPIWFGGYDPPARYLVSALPALIVPVSLALDRTRGRVGWAVVTGLYGATVAYGLVVSIWPVLRYQSATGRATALAAAWRLTGVDLGALAPTFVLPGRAWVVPVLVVLGAAAALGPALARRPGAGPPAGAVVAGLLGAVAIAAAAGTVAWLAPARTLGAAAWVGRGGTTFRGVIPVDAGEGSLRAERLVWAAQRDSALEVAPRLPRGRYRLQLRVGSQGTGAAPVLELEVGGAPLWRVRLEGAPPPAWRERDYTEQIAWPGGRLPVRVRLTGIAPHEPVALAYVEALRIARLPP